MTNHDPNPATPMRLPDDDVAAPGPEPSDPDLLKRYVDQRDETAFAALVHRYGPLVLGVCRRVLGHEQDSEDAFQATFLVLARKAGAISKGASMGGWLYRVAYRIARKLKGRQARRQRRERAAEEFAAAETTPAWVWREVGIVLDEEVSRLPEKYRLPFILCYLHGKTNEEAARQLACPVGTLASRLAWARERLRVRLTRRGVTLSTALLAGGLAAHAGPVPIPGPLAQATIQTGLRFGAGQAVPAESVPVQLAREYLRSVLRGRFLVAVAVVAVLGLVITLVTWSPLLRPGRENNARSVEQDLARFQGTWRIAELEGGGQPVDPQGTRMIFTDHTGRLDAGGGQPFLLTFELVPSQQPKRIDLVLIGLGNVPAQGIYAFDGDVLRICYSMGGAPRPTEFVTHPNTQEILYVLRRE
jgi:RNA polymerase sigma factor (sigma-70 family)